MRSIRIPESGLPWDVVDSTTPIPGPDQALVEIQSAALNHRDVWIAIGKYAGIQYPVFPGSDGAGVVTEVGSKAHRDWVGRDVILNPSLFWGEHEVAFGDSFQILGMPSPGTLSTHICVPVSQLEPRPPHLNPHQAAALPLAGLTAYRALFSRAKLQPGETILITGIGGGVAMIGLQFALAAGATVFVTSSSEEKIKTARSYGAKAGFDYRQSGWTSALREQVPQGVDVILDGSAGPGMTDLMQASHKGGRIVCYGATAGNPPELPWRTLFWNQISLLGTTMGSPGDFHKMIEFVSQHKVIPVVDHVFPFTRINEAVEKMKNGGQCGKLVIDPRMA